MPNLVRFDGFEVDLDSRQLHKRGLRIKLPYQCLQVLACLLEHPGCAVTREDLRRRLWCDKVFVDFDNSLNILIARLREVLGDSAEHPRFIETLPKYGYRFIAEVYTVHATAEAGPPRRPRLLVLPFVNLSGDSAEEYFSDAVTDEIITAVAGIAPEHLAVIARTTAMHYKGSHKEVGRIGRELNVDYVVEGGVRRDRDRVGINVQLIQAGDQAHVFAKKYDEEMGNIFSVYSCIAQAITRHIPAIADAIRDGEVLREQVRRKPTEDLAAYNEYIKGRYEMFRYTAESAPEAKRHFEAALVRDPGFALACNALAELYWAMGFWGYAPSKQTDPVGRSYALRAMEIDSTSAETHALLSLYPKKRNSPGEIDYYDWAGIQKEVAQARALDPTSRMVRIRHAIVQTVLGHIEEAAAEVERALESDPLAFDVRGWLAMTLCLGRHLERALDEAVRLRDLEPEHFVSYHLLGYVYLGMQRFEDSAAAFRKSFELSRELPIALALLGLSLGLGGHRREAQGVLERLRVLARQQYVLPTCFAWTHLGLGHIDETFLWMDRAIDEPDRHIEPIKTYPFLDPLRTDPRFTALLRKMNLA